MSEFHDSTDEEMLRKIIKEKKTTWLALMDKSLNNKNWSEEEIRYVLRSVQDFISGDFPEKRLISAESLRQALDNMTRVALSLSNKSGIDRQYITRKLCQVLSNLK
ncbi:MAG TPA: hypothetical protein VGL27_03750 [Negativicutes bacterium]|jgi:hypothetical protein